MAISKKNTTSESKPTKVMDEPLILNKKSEKNSQTLSSCNSKMKSKVEKVVNNNQSDLPQDRQKLIQLKAWLKAKTRNFKDGNELQDWLEAEQEVDSMYDNKKSA